MTIIPSRLIDSPRHRPRAAEAASPRNEASQKQRLATSVRQILLDLELDPEDTNLKGTDSGLGR